MKKQSLVKGTLILGLASVFTRFIGIFFRIPVQNLIGDEGMGYYQMSYPLYAVFIAVSSGIPIAVSKMVSERNAINDRSGAVQVLRDSVVLMGILSIGFTGSLLAFSKNIVYALKWDPKAYYALIAIAIAPVFIAIMSCLRGFFQGLQNMNPTAVSQMLEQVGRVVVGVGLAYLLMPKGIEFAAAGAALGAAAGGIISDLYLCSKYVRVRKEFYRGLIMRDKGIMEELLSIAIPISLGAAVGGVMSLVDSILVPQKLLQAGFTSKEATVLYSQLTGKASVLINVPLGLSVALGSSLVPIISEAFILNRRMEVKRKVETALKISFIISIPSFFGLYFMAHPILNLVFNKQVGGYHILQYLSISIPFIIMAQTTTSILQGTGNFRKPVINLFIGCIIKSLVTFYLVSIPAINVYGAVIGSILGYIAAALLNLKVLKKHLNISVNYYQVMIKPLYASVIMTFFVVFIYKYVYNYTMSINISCLSAILAGIVVYGILICALGIFSYKSFKKRFMRK
ncbi:putative polysaccharide biosynthesis protein [Haloimpatiens lingqiaonensis]|uniref:putative polysaccharide biosynthesis protein n=1 Tax=Haloimpatiens lingqiaonensis TaxID=1380675 RepID=UPI0010FEC542|nr:polysaccharide biosynthesis protein [Haloimpatiens lingqiaonensis]